MIKMAKAPVTPKLVNKKGGEKKEYPKLVKTSSGKVLVQNAEEEAAVENKIEDADKKPAGWLKK